MKNVWLDRKAKRIDNEKTEEVKKQIVNRRLAELRTAVTKSKPKKKPCGCNEKFLKEAMELEKVWKKSGLLEGLQNRKWDRQSCAVLLEGQRLINEMPYQITVKTKTTQHNHGFGTKQELFSHLDMLMKDTNKVWFFETKLDRKPDNDHTFVFLNTPSRELLSDFMMHRANSIVMGKLKKGA